MVIMTTLSNLVLLLVEYHNNLTISGYPQYNNTVVRCNAAGLVDGNSYFNLSESTLRIQGNTLSDTCHYTSSH